MAKWVQWLIDRRLRYLVYVIAIFYLPFTFIYNMATEYLPDIYRDICRDFREIKNATITKEKI